MSEVTATSIGSVTTPGTPAPAAPRRVLVIDDEDVMLMSCRRILEKGGYTVETFSRGQAGIERLKEWRPQILLVDLKMPELDGFQVIERVRAVDPDVVIVVITGYATITTAVDAMKAGAYDFLPKPCTPDELRLVVARAHERWNLVRESQRLRREKEEAERHFVTLVSHQLKTPLVAVKQYLDVLLHSARKGLPLQAVAWIEQSQERLREMLGLIDDWLTLARVERGVLGTKALRTDLTAITAQVLQAVAPQAEAAGVTVRSELEPDLPCVTGDPVAVSTVLSNLVVNGIKYNRRGGAVTVRGARQGDHIVLEVRDDGIGIPSQCLPDLFREFYRIRSPETRDIPGTGLGLAICKRIVTELGGEIGVESREGRGSTFVVRFIAA